MHLGKRSFSSLNMSRRNEIHSSLCSDGTGSSQAMGEFSGGDLITSSLRSNFSLSVNGVMKPRGSYIVATCRSKNLLVNDSGIICFKSALPDVWIWS